MSSWLFNVYMDTVMKEVKMGMGGRREIGVPQVSLYIDDLFFCGESEEDLRAMLGRFVDVCRGRGLKVNAGKSRVIVLGWEEELV